MAFSRLSRVSADTKNMFTTCFENCYLLLSFARNKYANVAGGNDAVKFLL